MGLHLFSVAALFVALFVSPCKSGLPEDKPKKELFVLAMAPTSDLLEDSGWDSGPALIPAARLAVDQINNRSDILRGYSLKLLEENSGCKLTDTTMINFLDAEFYKSEGRGVVGVVGPRCSESTLAIADHIGHSALNLMQISISYLPAINGDNYQNSFRTVPSAHVYIDAFLCLMNAAKWNRLVVLYDTRRLAYSSLYYAFKQRMGRNMIYAREFGGSHLRDVFLEIDHQTIQIVLVFAGLREAQRLLCFMYTHRSQYINVQFIFMDLVREDILNYEWFIYFNCTFEDMEQALNNVIFITNQFQRADMESNDTLAGISYKEYEILYHEYLDDYLTENKLNKRDLPAIALHYFNAYYDAVWAFAIALNNSMTSFNLTKYGFNRPESLEIGNAIQNNFKKVSFQGMSGLIQFNESSRDVSSLGVILNQTVRGSGGLTWESHTGLFINGTLDFDNGTYLPNTLASISHSIHIGIGLAVLVIAILSVVCLIVVQIMFSLFLNMAEVKASSPQLNYLILSGCCLYLAALFIYTFKEVFPSTLSRNPVAYGISCSLQLWCFSLAFSLIFGTICAKTWRIYRIFTHFKQGRVKYVSDELLISSVVCLLLIDVAFLTTWNVVDPWRIHNWPERVSVDLIIIHHRCTCNNVIYWLPTLLVQKVILILLAVFLSILVRPVKKKGFKNTKSILVLIYSLAIIHILGISIYSLFDQLHKIPIVSFLGLSLMFVFSLITVTLSLFLTHIWPALMRRKSVKGPLTNNPYHTTRKLVSTSISY